MLKSMLLGRDEKIETYRYHRSCWPSGLPPTSKWQKQPTTWCWDSSWDCLNISCTGLTPTNPLCEKGTKQSWQTTWRPHTTSCRSSSYKKEDMATIERVRKRLQDNIITVKGQLASDWALDTYIFVCCYTQIDRHGQSCILLFSIYFLIIWNYAVQYFLIYVCVHLLLLCCIFIFYIDVSF